MEERTELVEAGRHDELADLEKRCLEENAKYTGWECTQALMATTNDALYMHCLPADITGVSCERGEVSSDVFEEFRVPLYNQAANKPYIIAAMILASRAADPRKLLMDLYRSGVRRMR